MHTYWSTYVGKYIQLRNTKNVQFEVLCWMVCKGTGVTVQARISLIFVPSAAQPSSVFLPITTVMHFFSMLICRFQVLPYTSFNFSESKADFFFLAFFFYSENYGIDFNQHFNATLIFPLRITMDLIFCHAHSNDNITSRHNCHNTSRHSWGNAFGWVAVLVFQFKKKYIYYFHRTGIFLSFK